MRIIPGMVIVSMILLPLELSAQEHPTVFPALGNENLTELDALTGRCSSDDGGATIDCLFITVILNRDERNDGTVCRLWGTAGTELLSREAPGVWAVETEPSGLCGVYNRVEFSCDESMFRCEFFEKSTYTVTSGEACEHYADLEDPGDRYSWRISEARDLTCDSVEFSYD